MNMTVSTADILVVEDDAYLRELLRIVLGNRAYSLKLVTNGDEAVRYLSAGAKPRLILLDMMMPIMDGSAFLAWLAGQPEISAGVKVIVLSAVDVEQVLGSDLQGRDLVSAFVRKPVVVTQLLASIQQALDAAC